MRNTYALHISQYHSEESIYGATEGLLLCYKHNPQISRGWVLTTIIVTIDRHRIFPKLIRNICYNGKVKK